MKSPNAGSKLPALILSALRIARKRRWSGTELSAEDASQEVAARLLSASANVEIVRAPRAYIGQALRNLGVDERRKIRAQGGAALPLENLDAGSLPWVAPDQEAALLLKQVILGLPPLYRDTFILNRFIGLSYVQIAQRHGITTKAVEYRMSRALALCQEALRD